jgi:hypothetical protein
MQRVSDLDGYIRSVEQSLRTGDVDPDSVAQGQYEGLLATGPARLHPLPGESEKHHSGYLLGHLIRWVHDRGRAIDSTVVGLTLYGSAIAHSQAQAALARDDGVVRAHQYAAILAERKLTRQISDSDERMGYGWLCEQADLAVTPDMVARLERLRARRHEKYGLTP